MIIACYNVDQILLKLIDINVLKTTLKADLLQTSGMLRGISMFKSYTVNKSSFGFLQIVA